MTQHGEQQYLTLAKNILCHGVKKTIFSDKQNVIGVVFKEKKKWKYREDPVSDIHLSSLIGESLSFDLTNNKIPLLTTKNVYWQGAFKEMLWFIEASADVAKLHRDNVPFWTPWAYKHFGGGQNIGYEEFQKRFLEPKDAKYIIPIPYTDSYKWDGTPLNQSRWVTDRLRRNPERKSYMVSAWNPTRLYEMAERYGKTSVVIAACHTSYQLLAYRKSGEDKLSLNVHIRSQDLPIGAPINIAQYALLTHMYAFILQRKADKLTIFLGDVHIYSNEVDGVIEQLKETPQTSPKITIKDRGQQYLQDFKFSDFKVEGYKPAKIIPFELTVVGGFANEI